MLICTVHISAKNISTPDCIRRSYQRMRLKEEKQNIVFTECYRWNRFWGETCLFLHKPEKSSLTKAAQSIIHKPTRRLFFRLTDLSKILVRSSFLSNSALTVCKPERRIVLMGPAEEIYC
jgi:hypothetical protein